MSTGLVGEGTPKVSLSVGSLFSGIGGLDLGLERAGMTVRWQSEVEPFCCQVLAKHWPTVPNLGDVTEVDWESVERVDLICGGYPCQPFSYAGNREGASDERHLWPHMRDAVRVLRPRYVLIENVPGHLSLGFDVVLADLAALGFDADWSIVSACSVGASHSRDRLFALAYPAGTHVASPLSHRSGETSRGDRRTEPRGSRRTESRPGRWLPEPPMDRMAAGLPRRVVRAPLEALGNAVVPQVAEFIGSQLLASLEAVA